MNDHTRSAPAGVTTLGWSTPRSVSIVPDVVDARGFGVHDRFGDTVQLTIGRSITVTLSRLDGGTTVHTDLTVAVPHVTGVLGIAVVLTAENVPVGAVEPVAALASAPVPRAEPRAVPPSVPLADVGAPDDETIVVEARYRRAPSPAPALAPVPVPDPPSDGDGDVDVDVTDFDETVVVNAAHTGAPAPGFDDTVVVASTLTEPSTVTVVIREGTLERPMRVQSSLVLGRAPRVPSECSAGATALVIVGSDGDRVSASHLLIRNESGIAIARDLWSTNGTAVTPPYGAPYRLRGGEDAPILPGSLLELSDDIRVLIALPDHVS